MKKRRVLTLVMLFVMSFQTLHAFAIEMFDTHECHVGEYVVEFSHPITVDKSGDICNIHSAFHHSFIIPEYVALTRELLSHEQPQASIKSYSYDATKNFLKPPRVV